MPDVFIRISASRSSRPTCARSLASNRATCPRSLYEDLLCKMSVSRSSQQDPVKPLVQDLCMRISCACLCARISASGSCARSLYADLSCKISLSVRMSASPLMKDLCMRISCARSLCQELASGCCRTSRARSLYDLLHKVFKSS